MEIELEATPRQAIRIFRLDSKNMLLRSIGGTGEIWIPGEDKQSICIHARAHGSLKPEADCTCGIWSCNSRAGLTKTFPDAAHQYDPQEDWLFRTYPDNFLSAQILQWGQIVEHEWGYRSEFARILPHTIQWWPRTYSKQKKLINYLREKYAA